MVLMAFRRLSVQFRVPAHALLLPLAISDILIGAWSVLNIINVGEDNEAMARVSVTFYLLRVLHEMKMVMHL